jgi:hypothetical protein
MLFAIIEPLLCFGGLGITYTDILWAMVSVAFALGAAFLLVILLGLLVCVALPSGVFLLVRSLRRIT